MVSAALRALCVLRGCISPSSFAGSGRLTCPDGFERNTGRPTALAWFRSWKAQGREGLTLASTPGGRPRRLTERQRQALARALEPGPERCGRAGSRWSLESIAELISVMFGVRYHPSHVSRILGDMGWYASRALDHRERVSHVVDPDGHVVILSPPPAGWRPTPPSA